MLNRLWVSGKVCGKARSPLYVNKCHACCVLTRKVQSRSRTRIAISNPKNVAPFAKGELGEIMNIDQVPRGSDITHRMRVGTMPRVNAEKPSVRHTVRTQSKVDLYFWPVAGEKPSVCILDLIMSIGYITAHSCGRLALNLKRCCGTYSIACSSSIENCVQRTELISSNTLIRYLSLYQGLIG